MHQLNIKPYNELQKPPRRTFDNEQNAHVIVLEFTDGFDLSSFLTVGKKTNKNKHTAIYIYKFAAIKFGWLFMTSN